MYEITKINVSQMETSNNVKYFYVLVTNQKNCYLKIIIIH